MGHIRHLLLLGSLLLAACAPATTIITHDTPPPTAGGRLCAAQCRQAQDFCHKSCELTRRTCFTTMQAQAIKDYESYMQEVIKAHQPTGLFPRDFERPETCLAAPCLATCDPPYQSCYQACGGKLDITTSCQAFCF